MLGMFELSSYSNARSNTLPSNFLAVVVLSPLFHGGGRGGGTGWEFLSRTEKEGG